MHISNYLPATPTEDPRNPSPEYHPSHSHQVTTQHNTPPAQHNTRALQQKLPPEPNHLLPHDPLQLPPENRTAHTNPTKTHQPETLTATQSEYPNFTGLMCPHPETNDHQAFNLLLQYATTGCPADCGQPWTQAHLEAAICQGAHPSTHTPDAAMALWAEALEKVRQGFARLVMWDSIKDNPPTNLKISPLAAVPHKSCWCQAILDLSFQICLGGLKLSNSEFGIQSWMMMKMTKRRE